MKTKRINQDDLASLVEKYKTEGKTVAATGGCFDILHAGHVQYLEKAKSFGDILILFLNSDNSIKRIKGEKRPIVPENERAQVIAGLGCIDYVCVFDEDTPCQVIEKIKPDVWVKGADYKNKTVPEQKILAGYGGKIEYIDFLDGCSSTNIITKILDVYKES